MAKRTGIILLSGGLDSTTLLWEYRDEIALAVSFDYGSKHNAREIAMARYQADSARSRAYRYSVGFYGRVLPERPTEKWWRYTARGLY